MDRPLRADRLGRAVALLALVVGLLGMHGVAGVHHAGAAVPTHPAAADASSDHAPSTHEAAPTGHGATPASHSTHSTHAGVDSGVPLLAAAALPGAGLPDCGDDCEPGVATLCVAMLAVTALAVAAGHVARSRARTSHASGRPRARAPGVRRLPPRLDPVAELCVSRT